MDVLCSYVRTVDDNDVDDDNHRMIMLIFITGLLSIETSYKYSNWISNSEVRSSFKFTSFKFTYFILNFVDLEYNFTIKYVFLCFLMPTHYTITCFGFRTRRIDGVECSLFSILAPLGQTTLCVRRVSV